MRKKVVVVFGTRPEAIKLAPVIALLKQSYKFRCIVCVTAQHRNMLDQVLRAFQITPHYDLNIMKPSQDLFDVTICAMKGLKRVLHLEKPDLVLVQGDTTTAFCSALAAYYLKIPIGHIEAGLRTYNKYSPFPEEINRQLLSNLVDYHFAPTLTAQKNLIKAGIDTNKIWVTGNTVVDALNYVTKTQFTNFKINQFYRYFRNKYNIDLKTKLANSKLILVTGHRRENFGKRFKDICNALRQISETRNDVIIIYPVHLNPNVKKIVLSMLSNVRNVCLIEPLNYIRFVLLMKLSYIILSDSGGVQEEAPSLGKPVLVMRDTTERPEGIAVGCVKLVGTDPVEIVNATFELLDNHLQYRCMSRVCNPYGDGNASRRITRILGKGLA